jgi:hypothetical protein
MDARLNDKNEILIGCIVPRYANNSSDALYICLSPRRSRMGSACHFPRLVGLVLFLHEASFHFVMGGSEFSDMRYGASPPRNPVTAWLGRQFAQPDYALNFWFVLTANNSAQSWDFSGSRRSSSLLAFVTVRKQFMQIESQEPSGLCLCRKMAEEEVSI